MSYRRADRSGDGRRSQPARAALPGAGRYRCRESGHSGCLRPPADRPRTARNHPSCPWQAPAPAFRVCRACAPNPASAVAFHTSCAAGGSAGSVAALPRPWLGGHSARGPGPVRQRATPCRCAKWRRRRQASRSAARTARAAPGSPTSAARAVRATGGSTISNSTSWESRPARDGPAGFPRKIQGVAGTAPSATPQAADGPARLPPPRPARPAGTGPGLRANPTGRHGAKPATAAMQTPIQWRSCRATGAHCGEVLRRVAGPGRRPAQSCRPRAGSSQRYVRRAHRRRPARSPEPPVRSGVHRAWCGARAAPSRE